MSPLLLLAACAGPSPDTGAGALDDGIEALDGPRLVRRMSLDLRGALPAPADLESAEGAESAAETIRDAYLEDPLFEERLVRLLGEQWLTRIDDFEAVYYDYELSEEENYTFLRSVGEEPLRLMARIVADDRPWIDAVTADHTIANELMAEMWGLDYPEGESGWQAAYYGDGRPAAGVLSTNGLWWRYITNLPNQNRARVAAIADLLICEDILGRPVTFSASDALDSETAIREDPYCLGCHSAIEPIAATLFGFYWLKDISAIEMQNYHPERERMGPDLLGVEPAWYGQPLTGLVDLGWAIAADERFPACAAERFSEALLRRQMGLDDFDRLDRLRRGFINDGMQVKPLLRAITDDPTYRAAWQDPDVGAGETEITYRMMNADLLESTIEQLTGFSWQRDGYALMDNDVNGYRLMSGGVDGLQAFTAGQDPALTWALVVKRLAEGGAQTAVQRELIDGGERALFDGVTLDDAPGDAAFTDELRALHWRLYGIRADDDFLAGAESLWTALDAAAGPETAWVGLVSGMLRDPMFLGY